MNLIVSVLRRQLNKMCVTWPELPHPSITKNEGEERECITLQTWIFKIGNGPIRRLNSSTRHLAESVSQNIVDRKNSKSGCVGTEEKSRQLKHREQKSRKENCSK